MTKPTYRLTFFIKEEPALLFPLLLPFHFKWAEQNSIRWENEGTRFQIIPFTSKGTDMMGYRVLYTGNPDSFVYLADQFLGSFSPTYSGIEWMYESGQTQDELVRIAEKYKFTRCSMYGLYEQDKIGIVLLKNGEINLQIRNRSITSRNIASFMYEIEMVSRAFQPKEIDLFSFMDERVEAS